VEAAFAAPSVPPPSPPIGRDPLLGLLTLAFSSVFGGCTTSAGVGVGWGADVNNRLDSSWSCGRDVVGCVACVGAAV
jgi:hypothetical protein